MKIDKKILKQLNATHNIKQTTLTKTVKAKTTSSEDNFSDEQLFKNAVGAIKPLKQDKVTLVKPQKNIKEYKRDNSLKNQQAEFYFSDSYEPHLPKHGAMKYVREGVSSFESKALRRGDYLPEFILDLHGLTQQQAKQEIAALLYESKKQLIQCVCIVHGIGSKVLKNKVPHWLVQHPSVMAFHQATLEWGGDGALLVLLELEQK